MKTKGKFEPRVLQALKDANANFKYEAVKLAYTVRANYVPDIMLIKKDKTKMFIELKGRFRAADRRKMISVKECWPDLDLRIVFQKLKAGVDGAAKRKDGTRMTCEEWAIKYGFKYAEGIVPQEWLEE